MCYLSVLFSDSVEKFISVVNDRLNQNGIKPGSTWVRIQPPYDWKLADVRVGPWLMAYELKLFKQLYIFVVLTVVSIYL